MTLKHRVERLEAVNTDDDEVTLEELVFRSFLPPEDPYHCDPVWLSRLQRSYLAKLVVESAYRIAIEGRPLLQ